MSKPVKDLTPPELHALLQQHGTITGVAKHLGVPRKTLSNAYGRLTTAPNAPRSLTIPRVTKNMLDAALLPPNNCQVGRLLHAIRDAGETDTLETVETMLALPARELPAERFRATLHDWGFPDDLLPDKNHVATHRNSILPCRCSSYAAVKEHS